MSFKEKVVVSILLLVARMLCEDDEHTWAIKNIATHISVHAKEPTS